MIGKITSLSDGIRVTFPQLENTVSYKLKKLKNINIDNLKINDNVLVMMINNNLKDSIIIGVIG